MTKDKLGNTHSLELSTEYNISVSKYSDHTVHLSVAQV